MKKIETRSGLFREYARVIDLCNGTTVNPDDCVRYNNKFCRLDFREAPSDYIFAISIVENKPVFVGDFLYHPKYGEDAQHIMSPLYDPSRWSWEKPDQYAHLRKAQEEGKRIAFLDGDGWRLTAGGGFGNHPPDRYKIVEDDVIEVNHFPKIGRAVRLIKSGLDGNLIVEVIG